MKILINGATSMIGSVLCNKLVEEGHCVIALTRRDSINIINPKLSENLKIFTCDMSQYENLASIIREKIDVAFAIAWKGTRGTARDDKILQKISLEENKLFLQQAFLLGCKKFFTSGSQAEYGSWTGKNKVNENTETIPDTEYGLRKLDFYKYATEYCRKRGMVLIEPRFFSIYGPNDYSDSFIISTLKKMLSNDTCELTRCIQLWDFLYVDDAVNGLIRLMQQDNVNGVFNFGSGIAIPLSNYVIKMLEITGSNSQLNYGSIPYFKGKIIHNNPNVSKLRNIGWKPETDFESGIKKIIEKLKFEEER